MDEEWRDIKGYEGYYQVSNLGRVKSLERVIAHPITGKTKLKGAVLRLSSHSGGYKSIGLSLNGNVGRYYVHRLVAQAFLSSKENKTEVNHINGIKVDNRAINLEWCTRIENERHARDTGLKDQRGEKKS